MRIKEKTKSEYFAARVIMYDEPETALQFVIARADWGRAFRSGLSVY